MCLLSGLSQLVDDLCLPSNTILGDRDVSFGLGNIVLLVGIAHVYNDSRRTKLEFDLHQTDLPIPAKGTFGILRYERRTCFRKQIDIRTFTYHV
jgi:hypothetical protein